MVMYRRNRSPGASYFFTLTLTDRTSHLLIEHIVDLRAAFQSVRTERPFNLDAVVFLPDHLHCIWTLPPGDADYAMRWREIKSRFSRRVPKGELRTTGRINKSERGRYWEHTLRDERDMERHVDYIHYNPVKHGHVPCVADWPYSSFHHFVQSRVYPPDWAGDDGCIEGRFGE